MIAVCAGKINKQEFSDASKAILLTRILFKFQLNSTWLVLPVVSPVLIRLINIKSVYKRVGVDRKSLRTTGICHGIALHSAENTTAKCSYLERKEKRTLILGKWPSFLELPSFNTHNEKKKYQLAIPVDACIHL